MQQRERIVIIEDEVDIRDVLQLQLTREGFRVTACADGEAGLAQVRSEAPDLVLLDLMLPGLDGLEVCRRLKADPLTAEVRVVMVSAKGEETDIVIGLELGADDYVAKPFSPRELLARIKAVLRRGPQKQERASDERISQDGLVIDIVSHRVTVHGDAIQLTATEMRLLHFLAAHAGRVFTRDQLLSRVIGDRAVVVDRNIDVHIGSVRRKLGECRDLIQTLRGVGYRFKEPGE